MKNSTDAIGVFDSGFGGISVLKELVSIMPNENYIYYGDSANAPYGIKTKEDIIKRCMQICDFFISKSVKAIVVACNTATSAAIETLRNTYKDITIVGMEPALKPAVERKEMNNVIVMATPLTLKEEKFAKLMKKYIDKNNIIKLPCPELVTIVENDMLDDEELINNQINKYFSSIDMKNVDSIVLGCTHFIFYKKYIKKFISDNTVIIDGNNGTARHLKKLLLQTSAFNKQSESGRIEFYNSNNNEKYIELSKKLFENI